MKRIGVFVLGATLLTTTALRAQAAPDPLVVTASNESLNQLLVFSSTGALLHQIPTGGQGGVGGNAGGVTVSGGTVAVVNFGSSTVTLFERTGDTFTTTQTLGTASAAVSVAFSKDHLYVLGTTTIESHRRGENAIDQAPDGIATLVQADGSAAQVGVAGDQLVISEKSNTVETVALRGGAVTGPTQSVALPPNSNAPFGLVTRGANAYVTIALRRGQSHQERSSRRARRHRHAGRRRAARAVLDRGGRSLSLHGELTEPQHLAARGNG